MRNTRCQANDFRLAGLIVALVIMALLNVSCAPGTYNFVGTWDHKPGTLTYVNYDQHIKLTFPSPEWRIYTRPSKDYPPSQRTWNVPTEDNRSYHVLMARVSRRVSMQLQIGPATATWKLKDYLSAARPILLAQDLEILESKVIQRNGQKLGKNLLRLQIKRIPFMTLFVVLIDKDRFLLFGYTCKEDLFESWEHHFWAIVDSYEYIAAPEKG